MRATGTSWLAVRSSVSSSSATCHYIICKRSWASTCSSFATLAESGLYWTWRSSCKRHMFGTWDILGEERPLPFGDLVLPPEFGLNHCAKAPREAPLAQPWRNVIFHMSSPPLLWPRTCSFLYALDILFLFSLLSLQPVLWKCLFSLLFYSTILPFIFSFFL